MYKMKGAPAQMHSGYIYIFLYIYQLALLFQVNSRTLNIPYYFHLLSSGDDTLLSTERTALHSAEMGSPAGFRYGVRNSDPQALPVRKVQSSPHELVEGER